MQAEIDELLIFVTVADKAGFAAFELGNGGDEFRLGAYFQPVVVCAAVLGDPFHHLLLLVDLDGEDAAVFSLVAKFGDGRPEALMEQGYLGIKNVFNAQENGHVVTAFLNAPDNLRHADFRAALAPEGADNHLALFGNIKIPRAPVAYAVHFGGIIHAPFLHGRHFGQFCPLLGRKGE